MLSVDASASGMDAHQLKLRLRRNAGHVGFVRLGLAGQVVQARQGFMGQCLPVAPSKRSRAPHAVVAAPPVFAPKASAKGSKVSGNNMSKFAKMRTKFGTALASEDKSGFTYAEFEKAISELTYSFQRGDRCVGRVYQFERNGALVDVGAKASAFCPTVEMAMIPIEHPEQALTLGEDREFQIIANEDVNGQLKVSLRRIEYETAWERVSQMQAEDVTIYADVLSINRGGALLMVEGLRAFLPGSHLAIRTAREDLVGAQLPLKFLEVDPPKNRLIVSHRRAMVEQQMARLTAGEVVEGVVHGIKPYGVFVDVGGLSGLLHISQISHHHVSDITSIIQEGSVLRCMVIHQDKEKGRISLSTKTLEPEPGDMLSDPTMVYARADEMAERYHKRLEEERKAAEDVADDIVSTLDMASLDDLEVDPIEVGAPSGPVE